MEKQAPVVCKVELGGTILWPEGQAFPLKPDEHGGCRFKLETRGPWQILTRLEGLAVEHTPEGIIVHGVRSLLHPRESGYRTEGQISIRGKKRRAFTSSSLFLVNGKLIDVGILYVCREKS